MKKTEPADIAIALSQILILALWEALGVFALGWNGLIILAVWFLGLWTFNVLVATATRTYYKMITPQATVVNNANVADAEVASGDILG